MLIRCTDRGLYLPANEQMAEDPGVQKTILPKPGYKVETAPGMKAPGLVYRRTQMARRGGRTDQCSQTGSRLGPLPQPRFCRLSKLGRVGSDRRKLDSDGPSMIIGGIRLLKNDSKIYER
jgi:hypothetical protein